MSMPSQVTKQYYPGKIIRFYVKTVVKIKLLPHIPCTIVTDENADLLWSFLFAMKKDTTAKQSLYSQSFDRF